MDNNRIELKLRGVEVGTWLKVAEVHISAPWRGRWLVVIVIATLLCLAPSSPAL
jgi:hypothetical protein